MYQRVDLALDSFPYHGTTTTCEALWMGVPVLTLAGRCHAARVGVSILSNVGLQNLITTDVDAYVRLAADLANDPSALAAACGGLRDRMAASPLTDAASFALRFEAALRACWRAWCKKR
jgi:predicted O-linked N-acetylglucosamine transferase (SPINDLY family)